MVVVMLVVVQVVNLVMVGVVEVEVKVVLYNFYNIFANNL